MIRGAAYRIDLGRPRGHEHGGRRLGLVLYPTNMPWSVTPIVPTSTSARPAVFRPELRIADEDTRLLVDQIRTIELDHVHGEPVDCLSRDDPSQVEQAVARYLGLASSAD
ncbi:type II toxin-antitoxin system PemK/MazF family toxin [Cellulomonas sp. S1-8]|uniref:type II toxin-antitoxin system PemK/MazF family toxin n=1 Tax=Cellulomonas sp. S1-8 TaxID=2904790 RepID=UPI002AD59DE3|nr:type II toxin-antitoxin system PemK/MazF family toxin [Cellulomonas sp. S1-8]